MVTTSKMRTEGYYERGGDFVSKEVRSTGERKVTRIVVWRKRGDKKFR